DLGEELGNTVGLREHEDAPAFPHVPVERGALTLEAWLERSAQTAADHRVSGVEDAGVSLRRDGRCVLDGGSILGRRRARIYARRRKVGGRVARVDPGRGSPARGRGGCDREGDKPSKRSGGPQVHGGRAKG